MAASQGESKQNNLSSNTEVIALHDFRAISNSDLSFVKNEILIILKATPDPLWYLARNKNGQEGRIPANYVKQLDPVPTWFHGKITSKDAGERLLPREEGLFLIRESITYPGVYVLCLCANDTVKQYRISCKSKQFRIGENSFDYLSQLVEHHKKNADGLCVKLIKMAKPCATRHDELFNINAKVLKEQGWTLKGLAKEVGHVKVVEQWRKRGNAHYGSALDESDPESRCEMLRMAYNCYSNSLHVAKKEADISSASKNLAAVSMQLAFTVKMLGEPAPPCRYYLNEAMVNFNKAFKYGTRSQSEPWLEHLRGSYLVCIKENIDSMQQEAPLVRVKTLEKMTQGMASEEFHSYCYLEIADILFHMSLKPLQDKAFAKALNYLAECHRPMEEARRLGRDNQYIQEQIRVLEEDIHMHMKVAESLQALKTGEDLLEKTLKDQEDLNMDMIFQVLDFYKTAILLSRETEVEIDAIASHKIGVVYDMLLMRDKAKEYLMRSIQLARSLHPKSVEHENWFQRSCGILEKYEWKARVKEETAEQKERKAHMKELSAEIKLLDGHQADSDYDFLKFVYETFKPIKQSQTLNTEALDKEKKESLKWKEALKKLYLKANLHYHPDKQSGEDRKHVVLFEEITKRLNERYNHMKFD